MSDGDLIGGIYPKLKNEKAPDFVICKMSINVGQFRDWMQSHLKENPGADWINMDCLLSRNGKGYAKLDTWEPDVKREVAKIADSLNEDEIPF
tara:strand:- start:829 stop:1107 length:279 start_codon:yes stop_codon:yes gene_type:complete